MYDIATLISPLGPKPLDGFIWGASLYTARPVLGYCLILLNDKLRFDEDTDSASADNGVKNCTVTADPGVKNCTLTILPEPLASAPLDHKDRGWYRI